MVYENSLQEAYQLRRSLADLGERYILKYVIDRLEQLNGSLLPPGDDTVDMILNAVSYTHLTLPTKRIV